MAADKNGWKSLGSHGFDSRFRSIVTINLWQIFCFGFEPIFGSSEHKNETDLVENAGLQFSEILSKLVSNWKKLAAQSENEENFNLRRSYVSNVARSGKAALVRLLKLSNFVPGYYLDHHSLFRIVNVRFCKYNSPPAIKPADGFS